MFRQRFLVLSLGALLISSALAQEQTPPRSSPQPTPQDTPQQTERALARAAGDSQLEWGPCPEFLPSGCAIAVLHGDPAGANADIFFRVPAGAQIPLHWHTSAERMVLVAGDLQVTYTGQDPIALRPGTYAYGPAKLPHQGRCGDAGPCVLFIAFEGPVDAVAGNPPQ